MYLVMTIKDNLPQDVILVTADREKAQKQFLKICDEECKPGVNKYERLYDREDALDDGYVTIAGLSVVLIDTDGPTSDADIRDELTKQPHGDMTVAEIINEGEISLKEGMTVDQILAQCGDNLDAACSWDIQGQVVFKGSDGVWYTITTESTIGECTNEFITDVLSEIENG